MVVVVVVIITMTVFMVLPSSHCKSLPGLFDECRLSAEWPPTLRPLQLTWAASLPKIGSYHPHPPRRCYYYSGHKLIFILLPHKGWKAGLT